MIRCRSRDSGVGGRRSSLLGFLACFSLLVVSCVNAESMLEENSLLLKAFYSRSMIQLDTPGKVDILRVDYKDIDKGVVDYDDEDPGSSRIEEFVFSGRIVESDVILANGNSRIKESSDSFTYTSDSVERRDLTGKVERYSVTPGLFTSQNKDGGGWCGGVITVAPGSVRSWNFAEFYSRRPDRADIELKVSGTTSIITHLMPDGSFLASWRYESRIPMGIEYKDGRKYEFSVASGDGEVLGRDSSGKILERWSLRRKVDSKGHLVYERVIYPKGSGEILSNVVECQDIIHTDARGNVPTFYVHSI